MLPPPLPTHIAAPATVLDTFADEPMGVEIQLTQDEMDAIDRWGPGLATAELAGELG